MKVDLHSHTTYSDGTYTPAELISYAKEKGLSAIAVTDHDSISGVQESKKLAEQSGIEFVEGIEFAAQCIFDDINLEEIHILGYFVDTNNSKFIETVNSISEGRYNRNAKMIELFGDEGIHFTMEDLLNGGSKDKIITRSHFAQILVDKGIVKTKDEAFPKYLRPGAKTYLPREYYTPKECVEIIHQAGGIAVLAHPTLYGLDDKGIEILIKEMKNIGMDGVECIYSTYSPEQTEYVTSLAKKYNLVKSGGSDFHGETKPGLDLAVGFDNLHIPYEIYDNMLKYRNNFHDNEYNK